MEKEGTELYDAEKLTRFVGDGVRQEWYGVKETEKGLACAGCNAIDKAEKLLTIHGAACKEIIWRCRCGNYIVSITHTANRQDQ